MEVTSKKKIGDFKKQTEPIVSGLAKVGINVVDAYAVGNQLVAWNKKRKTMMFVLKLDSGISLDFYSFEDKLIRVIVNSELIINVKPKDTAVQVVRAIMKSVQKLDNSKAIKLTDSDLKKIKESSNLRGKFVVLKEDDSIISSHDTFKEAELSLTASKAVKIAIGA